MESRFKLARHPAHPILIVFPLGLLATSVIFDIVYLATDRSTMSVVAFWMSVAGIAGGFVAAVPGMVDWLSIPAGTRAKRVGAVHGLGNVLVLILFIISCLLRYDEPTNHPSILALVCSFAGFAIAGVTGWLGTELVYRLGVGVYDGAHLDAPNSLSGQPTGEVQTHKF